MITRREWLRAGLWAGASGLVGGSCARSRLAGRVVLYSSVDGPILAPILREFERARGVRVLLVGDTEATKTTGLMERARSSVGRFDVWWSNEAMASVRLADEGVLEPYEPARESEDGSRPGAFWTHADQGARWHGFSPRFRAVVFNPSRAGFSPRTLAEMATGAWRERLGIARPEFGTTRGHLGAMLSAWGCGAFEAWARAMGENRVRLYDGNSAVVRACAQGEIDAGLTDTDDVFAGKARGWPVDIAFERADAAASPASLGAMEIPNTIALARGAPNAEHARAFIDFALGEGVERALMASESRHLPGRARLRADYSFPVPEHVMPVDLVRAASLAPEAVEIASRAWG